MESVIKEEIVVEPDIIKEEIIVEPDIKLEILTEPDTKEVAPEESDTTEVFAMEPDLKKVKLEDCPDEIPQCKFFVRRKKRNCKLTVSKGKEYCGEHLQKISPDEVPEGDQRVFCPLDLKHTVYRKNLKKHLKVCNAREKPVPDYIELGINEGSDTEEPIPSKRKQNPVEPKLCEVDPDTLNNLIEKLQNTYDKCLISYFIEEVLLEHEAMSEEVNKDSGKERLKHVIQTSAILGYLERLKLGKDGTAYIEFGAGKGQVSYWLSKAISKHTNSKVVLIDKASHRHKQDNKVKDKTSVVRIRADIGNFCLNKFDLIKDTERVVGLSKHLCGAATDLALRCLVQSTVTPVAGFIIAVCCHHRCSWKAFAGKKFLIENGFDRKDFILITKMASWAVCGTGYSRERRKEEEEKQGGAGLDNVDEKKINEKEKQEDEDADLDKDEEASKLNLSRERRTEIGEICKRVLDYARVSFMEDNNYQCALKYYVIRNITLENVCIVGRNKALQ